MTTALYAVVDIETTGGMPKRDKITEIAVVLYDGRQIIDRFESLINPERSIPWEITRITGITDEMVSEAPKFYEIARQVVELTRDAVFVAHNVRFDYQFLREEFASLGYSFHRPQLCTVVLSRKSFPGLRSYSLGNLIEHFGIEVENRHRAMDDVLATVNILDRALRQESGVMQARRLISAGIRQSKTPSALPSEKIKTLPDQTGVYYFYNVYGHVIYVGKSIHIRKRVLQHFAGQDGKADQFISKIADITYTLTGSELIAMLHESSEIKALQPEINKAQRTKDYPYCIFQYTDIHGYLRLDWDKVSSKRKSGLHVLRHFSSKAAARSQLAAVCEQLQLCPGLAGLHEAGAGCFYYQTGSCLGACQQLEPPDAYNMRVREATDWLNRSFDQDFIVVTEGRTEEESGFVVVRDGHYRGFGYAQRHWLLAQPREACDSVEACNPNPECNAILLTWLDKHADVAENISKCMVIPI